MAETIFDKIITKQIPADIVYEDDEILAFKDIHPVAPVHILVIPKKFVQSLATLEEADALLIGRIHLVIRNLAEQYGIAKTGYRVVTNSGGDSGQEVPYLHFHLMGGKPLGSKIVA